MRNTFCLKYILHTSLGSYSLINGHFVHGDYFTILKLVKNAKRIRIYVVQLYWAPMHVILQYLNYVTVLLYISPLLMQPCDISRITPIYSSELRLYF